MQNVVDHWQAFNSWSSELPVYLQVFLGMSLFFVSAIGLIILLYYLTKLMLYLTKVPLLSHAVGLLGYLLMLIVSLLVYVAIPLLLMAANNLQTVNIELVTQTIAMYFIGYVMLTIMIMDFVDSRRLWRREDYTLSTLAKLFHASVWAFALGYPVIRRWHGNRS